MASFQVIPAIFLHQKGLPVGVGVMFVVDSADPGRLEEAKRTLLEVVGHEQLKGVPLEGRWKGMEGKGMGDGDGSHDLGCFL